MAELPSLRARVVASSAAVGALVGLLAASSAVALVWREQELFADRRLTEVATLFAGELSEAEGLLGAQVEAENAELLPLGLRLALFEGATCVGGDAALADVEGCTQREGTRACASAVGGRKVVVAGPDTALPFLWWLAAILLASGGAAAIGAFVSYFAGAWAVASLLRLRGQVAALATSAQRDLLREPATTAEVEALRAALDDLVGRLGVALERSRVFASSAAHELRTPLATLSAELELLTPERPDELREALPRLFRTLRRLTLLVDSLLALARGEAGLPLRLETLALEDVARDAVRDRSARDRARVALVVDDEGMLTGDETLLRAVVDNLLDNALKHGAGQVTLQVAREADGVRLCVRDEGPGVSREDWARLLAPFARGDSAASGHGLGLAIVQRAVEALHGSLALDGPAVRVTFPAWRPGPFS